MIQITISSITVDKESHARGTVEMRDGFAFDINTRLLSDERAKLDELIFIIARRIRHEAAGEW